MKTLNSLSELNTIADNFKCSNIVKKPFYEIKPKGNKVVIDKDTKTALHEFYLKEKNNFIGNEKATLLEINEEIILDNSCEYKSVSGSLVPSIHRLELKHFCVYLISNYHGCSCVDISCESYIYTGSVIKVRCKKTQKIVLTKENKTNVRLDNFRIKGLLPKEQLFKLFKENYLD